MNKPAKFKFIEMVGDVLAILFLLWMVGLIVLMMFALTRIVWRFATLPWS